MDKQDIFQNKKPGDIKMVAEIMGVSHTYADKILRRANCKRHEEAYFILKKIVELREHLKLSFLKK